MIGHNIEAIIAERGITEVLHFTTNLGLLGILACGSVKCRDLLEQDKYLEFIFRANANIRRDRKWTNQVNLSISRVNPSFFEISRRWHQWEGVWWSVLSFDPVVLCHSNVTFATTNNIWSDVRRGRGPEGLDALFAPLVQRYPSRAPATRTDDQPLAWTTCEEAEVLYPRELSTAYLRRVYLERTEHRQTAQAQLETLNHERVELVLAPEMFTK